MMWFEVSMDDIRVMPIVRLRAVHVFRREECQREHGQDGERDEWASVRHDGALSVALGRRVKLRHTTS